VGHHGSRSATGEDWLAELRPTVAVISSGAGNRYGHPHPEVLERLARHGIGVWRTDQQGTISLVTDGRRMTVSGRSQQASFPVMDEP
jgi:competence protein ComEC